MNLNLEKYERFFAFGCSCTSYKWPTWADIIAEEVKPRKMYNFGMQGGGNLYIAHSISEADVLYNFTKKDLVMVMWTNIHREDRFYRDKWLPAGNIYSQNYFPITWEYLYDDVHYLLRDLALITFAKNFLENKKIDHHFMSMVPLSYNVNGEDHATEQEKTILSKYDLSYIRPSILESVFPNNDWSLIQPRSLTRMPDATHHIKGPGWYEDNHPHPKEHLQYLKILWPETNFSSNTESFVNYWHEKILKTTEHYDKLFERDSVNRIHDL